jgi:hypothetical protein
LSPISTAAAPRMRADAADARPTGPAPATSTVDPALTLVVTAPWKSGRQNIGEAGQTKDLFSGPRERLRTANEDAGDRQAAAANHAKPLPKRHAYGCSRPGDVWARVGLARCTGQRQLNNFRLLEIGATTGAITAFERKPLRSGWIHFHSRPVSQTQFCQRRRCEGIR